MNCVWFEMRLDELLDERLPPDSDRELNEHVETCSHCAQLLADHQALLEAIEMLVRPEARGDLAARILAEVTDEPISDVSVLHRANAARQPASAQRSPLRAAMWIAATIGRRPADWFGRDGMEPASSGGSRRRFEVSRRRCA